MIYNEDPITHMHFGFGHGNMISGEALGDICQEGDDLVYDDALANLKEEFKDAITSFLSNNYLTEHNLDIDRMFDDNIQDIFSDNYQNDYCRYRYEKDGYIIEYDNNTNDLTVIKSPYYALRGICSPCAPNGGYLGSEGQLPTYCLGEDFFDEYNPMPYECFKVEDYLNDDSSN
jgi:hypothetical protein